MTINSWGAPNEPMNPAGLSAYSPVPYSDLSGMQFQSTNPFMTTGTTSPWQESDPTAGGQGSTMYDGNSIPLDLYYSAQDKSGPGYQATTFAWNPATSSYVPTTQMGSSNTSSLMDSLIKYGAIAGTAAIGAGGASGLLGSGTSMGAAPLGGSVAGDVSGGLGAAAAPAGSMTFSPGSDSALVNDAAGNAAANVAPQLQSDLNGIIANAGPGSALADALPSTGIPAVPGVSSGIPTGGLGSAVSALLGGNKGGSGGSNLGALLGAGGLGAVLGSLLSGGSGSTPPSATSTGASTTTLPGAAQQPFNYTPRPGTWDQFMNNTQPANNPWTNPTMAAMLGINPGDVGLRSFGTTGGQAPAATPAGPPSIRNMGGVTSKVGFADGGATTTSESNPLTILQELTGYGNPFGTTGSSASTPFWQRLNPGVMKGHGAGTYAKGGQTQASSEGPPVVGGLSGPGAGQDDDIPAQLSHGEYVMDADVVSALGDGNNEAGANKLDSFREAIRAHKRSAPNDKIPPKAKPLGAYLPKR